MVESNMFGKLLCMPFLCCQLDKLHEKHFQNMQFCLTCDSKTFSIFNYCQLPIFTRILITPCGREHIKSINAFGMGQSEWSPAASPYFHFDWHCGWFEYNFFFSHIFIHTSVSLFFVAISNEAHVERKNFQLKNVPDVVCQYIEFSLSINIFIQSILNIFFSLCCFVGDAICSSQSGKEQRAKDKK